MKRSLILSFGLAAAAVGWGLTGLRAEQSGTIDVSGYPPEVQKQYRVFSDKCSRCHDLARPFTAKYSTEAQWRDLVARMARKPGGGISPKDQKDITAFLVYYQKARSGNTPPSSGTSSVAPTGNSGEAAPAPAPAPTPVPPAARAEGAAAGGGLRVEVDAMPAQPIVAPVEGKWTTEAPAAGENLFLSVRLFDSATGEKVPYATVRARVGGDSAEAKPLRPLFGSKGFQYGGNFTAPAGDLEVVLEVEPPPLGRVDDDGHRWTSPLNLKLTLHGR
jgi:hypothetical protein